MNWDAHIIKPLSRGFFLHFLKRCVCVLFCFFLNQLAVFSQNELTNESFEIGEKLEYELIYQWGLIWSRAGQVVFTVQDTVVLGEKFYKLEGHGNSYSHWNWFYEVNSRYTSFADENLNSLSFTRKGKEGSNVYNRRYDVKPDGIYFTDYNLKGDTVYKLIKPDLNAKDVVTAMYFCRTLDFENRAVNDTIQLNFYLDGKHYPSYIRYLGETVWEHPKTGAKYDCYVFKPKLIEGTVFKSGENMTVYATRDKFKIPIYIETDLVVGKAKVFLK
jgi:hypothetical protein